MKTLLCFLSLDAFQSTVEKFGRLDIVINNAGINNEKELGKDHWSKSGELKIIMLEIQPRERERGGEREREREI